jgi:uncharacterized protein (DUF362 family)
VNERTVGIYRVAGMEGYEGLRAPFDPDAAYPELGAVRSPDPANFVFRAFREFLQVLEWDAEHAGTPKWNPFGWLIQPGQTVVIKPNLVVSVHPAGDRLVRFTDTDGPVIRAVAEYALVALAGRGTLVIGDSPIKETDFQRVGEITGLDRVVEALRRRSAVPVELVDFRDFVSQRDEVAMVGGRSQSGDPRGYTEFDLGQHSALDEVSQFADRLRSTAAYYENKMAETHNREHHRYSVANSVLHADVFINVPKLKTHCKAGVTVALKNLVGICNEKRWLPHHRKGSPDKGGDEYSKGASLGIRMIETLKDFFVQNPIGKFFYPKIMMVNKLGKKILGVDVIRRIRDQGDPYQNGGWYGNDTVWRMVLDLNKILRYGRRDGTLGTEPRRRVVTFVDGLWAGEGEGPLKPSEKVAGVMMAGVDSVLVDVVAATLMGFDYRKVRLLAGALAVRDYRLATGPVESVELVSNEPAWQSLDQLARRHLGFRAPRGWVGHIELEPDNPPSDLRVVSTTRSAA